MILTIIDCKYVAKTRGNIIVCVVLTVGGGGEISNTRIVSASVFVENSHDFQIQRQSLSEHARNATYCGHLLTRMTLNPAVHIVTTEHEKVKGMILASGFGPC
jgi:hypothetical protein